MNNQSIKKIISILSCVLLSALFIVTLFFCAPKIDIIPESSGEITEIRDPDNADYAIGTDITAIRINDLKKLGKIAKVNYIADQYVKPGSLHDDMQMVDLTKPFDFSEKGTLIFVIANLDPWAENFYEQSESMSEYKMGDYWHFTLCLPKIFSAANIYLKGELVARHGEIENYDFRDYNTNYNKKTEEFSSQTDTTYINLKFYTKREALANSFSSSQVITIHYQSSGSSLSGITGYPLIGTEDAVKSFNESSKTLLNAFSILAIVVFAVLVVLSLVEYSKKFISSILWIFGIMVLLFSHLFLYGTTTMPLFWSAVALAMPFLILGGAILAIGRNVGKIPTKFIFFILSIIGALLAFLCPFISFSAADAMLVVCTIIKAINGTALLVFIGWALLDKKDEHSILQAICSSLIAVAIIASLFLPPIFPAQINPLFWLSTIVTILTFISVIVVIMEMKKSNVYLTANLHKEVEQQVKDIKKVIADRDKLLQFITHDMKKPLSSAIVLCDTAIEREKDAEQIKTIDIIKQDTERVINHLSEIAAYAKLNYLAEPSQAVDMSKLCALLYKYHNPDCHANGIILKNLVDIPVKAFVKPKGIETVVSNIIINAIEHANCSTITLSIKKDKNKVLLCISDDGKGIDKTMDVFAPYISENDTETGGVGLYICKNIIESMNGELTYDSDYGYTIFYISLLKA